MDAVAKLRQEIALLEQEREQRRDEQHEREVDAFRAATISELGESLLLELGARFGYKNSRPYVALRYRNQEIVLEGHRGQAITKNRLLSSLDQVDYHVATWEKEREAARAEIIQDSPKWDDTAYILTRARKTVEDYRLQDDPDVVSAMGHLAHRIQAAEAERARVKKETEERKRAEREQERQRLLALSETASTWDELRPLAMAVSCDRWGYGEFWDDDELSQAHSAAMDRVGKLEEQREEKLRAAQLDAFSPFSWYRITYSIVACDGSETFADQDTFPSLTSEPDPDGWWVPANGAPPMRVAHLVKVERIDVTAIEKLPGWCPRQQTEWGKIQVPPAAIPPTTE